MTRGGDGFIECRCGQRHWGLLGAAGILAWRPAPSANAVASANGSAGAVSAGAVFADDAVACPDADARLDTPARPDPRRDARAHPETSEHAGAVEVLVQLRAGWSHHGGTWGVPGGAIDVGESPWEGALREFFEETGIGELEPPTDSHVLAHPDWSYTTFVAKMADPGADVVINPESADLRWVKASELEALDLLPPFRRALPELLAHIPA